ncbi:hypothetical protein HanHA300_Chr04g0138341 [Helianthus annuus]|nr:hypothetical protein HanHA300_Chr04g0138341 [Helianthus annuus]KAJ0597159.1 hypothetical protein HanHA89_Chr04g0151311 [Helianthus annuus]KAJ0757840.1 hypothetical protein HanLR1_Chr04g0143401 [Helianthus annuus]
MDNPLRLTDNSLNSLAQNCTQLESVSLSFSDGEFPSLSSFSLDGILSLITLTMCPVKSLFLDGVYSFNNTGGKRGMVSYMQVSVATELIYYLIMGYVLFANVNSTETLGGIGGMSYTICFGQIAGFETVDLCFKQKIISEVYISKTINGFLSSILEQSCWA